MYELIVDRKIDGDKLVVTTENVLSWVSVVNRLPCQAGDCQTPIRTWYKVLGRACCYQKFKEASPAIVPCDLDDEFGWLFPVAAGVAIHSSSDVACGEDDTPLECAKRHYR